MSCYVMFMSSYLIFSHLILFSSHRISSHLIASHLISSRIGQMFQKYKRGKGKKRLIWCPLSLDRILWGDEKKKKVKGYMMVCDIKGVTQGKLSQLSQP